MQTGHVNQDAFRDSFLAKRTGVTYLDKVWDAFQELVESRPIVWDFAEGPYMDIRRHNTKHPRPAGCKIVLSLRCKAGEGLAGNDRAGTQSLGGSEGNTKSRASPTSIIIPLQVRTLSSPNRHWSGNATIVNGQTQSTS